MTDKNTTGVLPASRDKRRRARRARTAGSGTSVSAAPKSASKSSASRQRPARPAPRQLGAEAQAGAGVVQIELSKSQVDQVIRAAGQGGTMSVLLSALKDPQWKLSLDSDEWAYPSQMDDRRLSRSLL